MPNIDKTSKIVITGGRGFLGQALTKELSFAGYKSVTTFGSKDFNLVSQDETKKMFFFYNPDVIINLAAKVGGIGANRQNPGKFAYENLSMGINILEEARQAKTPKVITTGTICSYPKFTPVPFVEENLWDGYPEETNAPYGLAKKMLLCMSQAYRQQYGCNFVFLLPVNMYGPNDSFDLETCHVIPAMIKRFHEAKVNQAEKVTLWGNGCPTREFLYVDDCAKAIIATMEKYDDPEPINIGTGQEISMRNLASTIKNIVQYNGTTCWDTSMPNGQPRRCLDVTRASKLLGWKADTSLNEGLVKTYEWYESKGISLD